MAFSGFPNVILILFHSKNPSKLTFSLLPSTPNPLTPRPYPPSLALFIYVVIFLLYLLSKRFEHQESIIIIHNVCLHHSPSVAVCSVDVHPKVQQELDYVVVSRAHGVVQGGDALVIGRARVLHLEMNERPR